MQNWYLLPGSYGISMKFVPNCCPATKASSLDLSGHIFFPELQKGYFSFEAFTPPNSGPFLRMCMQIVCAIPFFTNLRDYFFFPQNSPLFCILFWGREGAKPEQLIYIFLNNIYNTRYLFFFVEIKSCSRLLLFNLMIVHMILYLVNWKYTYFIRAAQKVFLVARSQRGEGGGKKKKQCGH